MTTAYHTWKQIDKYMKLCEEQGLDPNLKSYSYTLAPEERAQSMVFFLPRQDNREVEDYIVITPNGEHFFHDDYLVNDFNSWVYYFRHQYRCKQDK